MLDQFVFVYLDDILRARPLSSLALFQEYFCVIFSSDEQMHIQLVCQVLQRLLNHPLFVSCFTVSFLDFVVLGNTIQVDPALVRGKLQPCAFLSRIFRLLRGTTIWAIGNISSEVCHPAVKRTCLVIKERFWWPAIEKEVGEFVAVRQVWARNKVSRHPLAGLLCPLPVPHRLWSDI